MQLSISRNILLYPPLARGRIHTIPGLPSICEKFDLYPHTLVEQKDELHLDTCPGYEMERRSPRTAQRKEILVYSRCRKDNDGTLTQNCSSTICASFACSSTFTRSYLNTCISLYIYAYLNIYMRIFSRSLSCSYVSEPVYKSSFNYICSCCVESEVNQCWSCTLHTKRKIGNQHLNYMDFLCVLIYLY